MTAAASIDFAGVVARAGLRTILEADLGPAKVIGGRPHWHCPFHADGNPSLYTFDGGRRWRCWPCGLVGDVLDYLARRDGITALDAAKLLEPDAGTGTRRPRLATTPRPAPPLLEKVAVWQATDWQAAVAELVARAEEALWEPGGRDALDWLRGRGLEDHTIRRFRLGFLATEGWTAPVSWPGGAVAGIHHERGILLPWVAPGAWYAAADATDGPRWAGANVRRLMPDVAEPWPGPDKCRALKGSERGHLYPLADVLPAQGALPALVLEGELDALVAFQEAGWLALVGTVGGATQTPRPSALAMLARCPWWLLGFDHDPAGVEAARSWRDRAPHKARRVLLPHGKDLSDFHAAGGDVAGWLAGELARLGIAGQPALIRQGRVLCERCQAEGRTVAGKHVHRKRDPREYPEGFLDPDNVILLCASCPNAHTASQQGKGRGSQGPRR
jgi:CHC2 zinc finger/Toprim-like